MIRPVVRIAAVVIGLAAALYGVASLTGGWLGTPPWSSRLNERVLTEDDLTHLYGDSRASPAAVRDWAMTLGVRERRWAAWPGEVVVAAGAALAAFGAWPRRRPEVAS
jgi:hypothetical protein